jgi:thiol-disulfide isomerase/thioredoxin
MKRIFLSLYLVIAATSYTMAQPLQKSVKVLNGLHNASYTEVVKFIASFQDEVSIDTFSNKSDFIPSEPKLGGHYSIKGRKDVYFFDGNKSIWLNLRDTTYEMRTEPIWGQETRSLLSWAKDMNMYLKKPSQIKQLPDTTINHKAYDHTLVTLQDSTDKYEHVYSLADLVLDKTTHLPYSIITRIHGFANDGALIGWREEHIYTDYKLNDPAFPDLSDSQVPVNFKLPAKREIPKPFVNGTKAPQITLYDASGNIFDMEQLKGKTVLLNFTTIGCPHCINAAQMLKRLNQKYQDTSIVIISIYQLGVNTRESVEKFDQKYDIEYPSYTTENTAADIYHLSGYPNFYLVSKYGRIAGYYDGFYAGLEKEISDRIDEIK